MHRSHSSDRDAVILLPISSFKKPRPRSRALVRREEEEPIPWSGTTLLERCYNEPPGCGAVPHAVPFHPERGTDERIPLSLSQLPRRARGGDGHPRAAP